MSRSVFCSCPWAAGQRGMEQHVCLLCSRGCSQIVRSSNSRSEKAEDWDVVGCGQIAYCVAAMAIFGRRWGRQKKGVTSSVFPNILSCRICQGLASTAWASLCKWAFCLQTVKWECGLSWKSAKSEGVKLNCLDFFFFNYFLFSIFLIMKVCIPRKVAVE